MTTAITFEERERNAIATCQFNIDWYESHGRLAMWLYRGSQTATIVLSAAGAILILFTSLPKWLVAIAPAVASLVTGLNGLYQWREDWVRWLATAQALRTELANYQCRHPQRYGVELAPDAALDHFVVRMQDLINAETTQWQTLATRRGSRSRAG